VDHVVITRIFMFMGQARMTRGTPVDYGRFVGAFGKMLVCPVVRNGAHWSKKGQLIWAGTGR
jgi:hypothetical protein